MIFQMLAHEGQASSINTATVTGSNFDTVVTILMENNGICDILTSCGGSAPFMTGLATTNGIATHYTAVAHPSEPNYVALVGGSTFGISGDGVCCYTLNQPNLLDRLDAGNVSYSLFAESASGSGTCGFSPPRGADHFGFLEFSDNNIASRCSHFLTTSAGSDTEFLSLLNGASPSNYIWLTPTDSDNCHDTSVSVCDNYLSNLVPKILSSSTFVSKRAALFIVFDEGNGSNPTDYVYAMWAGPAAKKALSSNNQYSHYSYLHTIEANWNLATLTSNDAGAAAMSEFFGPSTPTALSANFKFTPTQPKNESAVTFTGEAVGGTSPYTFTWTFGDGGTSAANPATHVYALPGTFTVSLEVRDAVAATFTITQTVTVTQTSPPVTGNFGTCTPLPQGWSCGNILGLNGTTAMIANGILTTDLLATGVGGDNNPEFASSQKGTFPFSPCQAPAPGIFPSNLSVVSTTFTPQVLPTTDGRYHIYIALYYYLPNGPITANGATYQCLDTQSRVENVNGVFSSVGTTATYNPGDSFGWDNVTLGQVAQGQTYTLNANVAKQCAGDFARWGIPSSTTCQLAGIEIGVEGFMLQELKIQFTTVTLTTGTAPPPTLKTGFTFTPASPVVGQTVTFTATITGGTSPYTITWNFGDGATGTGSTATHAYSTAGTFSVIPTVNDSSSPQQKASSQQLLIVSSPPPPLSANFACSPASPQVGQSVSFTGSASGGNAPYTYAWNFGDSSTGSGGSVNHTYLASGSYTVTLTVTDANGKTAGSTRTITVISPPPPPLTASFTYSPPSPQTGQQASFAASASGGSSPYSLSWNFGDGSSGLGNSATHSYQTVGDYTVTLTATDAGGQKATSTQTITVTSPPPLLTVSFTLSPNSPEAGQTVSFTAIESGGTALYSYSWSFGDNGVSTVNPGSHTYSTSGSFIVTLTVADSAGVNASSSQIIFVEPAVTVGFANSPAMPEADQSVTFTATHYGGFGNISFSWDFGDSSGSIGNPATHTYTTSGNFLVSVIVTDAYGVSTTSNQTLTVTSSLDASFTFGPSSPHVGDKISFVGSASGGIQPYNYSWSFGDSTTSSGSSASHTYQSDGSYTVTLSVIDANNQTVNANETITVKHRSEGCHADADCLWNALKKTNFNAIASSGTALYIFNWFLAFLGNPSGLRRELGLPLMLASESLRKLTLNFTSRP